MLNIFIEGNSKNTNMCEYIVWDNEDNIHSCKLKGYNHMDICISKEYVPNKETCVRYKKESIK